jgi:3-isopropylmalate/(R)-2-methylmalate dehydratase small subunit
MTEPVRQLIAVAAPLIRANVDTDAIIPSREMKTVSKTGLAEGLFAGWRYTAIGGREPDPSFVLNQAPYSDAKILLGGENFGCGSSREHAVWALHEFGIRAVIAPSFAPIFFGNSVRNGIVPVRLAAEAIQHIASWVSVDPWAHRVKINVEALTVEAGEDLGWTFDLDTESREMLLEGLDAIDLTFKNKHDIEAFIARDRAERPWIYRLPEHA